MKKKKLLFLGCGVVAGLFAVAMVTTTSLSDAETAKDMNEKKIEKTTRDKISSDDITVEKELTILDKKEAKRQKEKIRELEEHPQEGVFVQRGQPSGNTVD